MIFFCPDVFLRSLHPSSFAGVFHLDLVKSWLRAYVSSTGTGVGGSFPKAYDLRRPYDRSSFWSPRRATSSSRLTASFGTGGENFFRSLNIGSIVEAANTAPPFYYFLYLIAAGVGEFWMGNDSLDCMR